MKLPLPPAEVEINTSLDGLAPRFRATIVEVLVRLDAAGQPGRVAETLRTPERQSFLYGFGRTYDDGRGIVTNARTHDLSWHGYGLAVDIVHATLDWNAPQTFWTLLRDVAEHELLVSGARWMQPDRPHVQWSCDGMHVTPSSHARELLATQGVEAVWKELDAL